MSRKHLQSTGSGAILGEDTGQGKAGPARTRFLPIASLQRNAVTIGTVLRLAAAASAIALVLPAADSSIAQAQTLAPDGVAAAPSAGQGGSPGTGLEIGDVGVSGTGGAFGPTADDGQGAFGPGSAAGEVGGSLQQVVSGLQGSAEGTEALIGALTGSEDGLERLSEYLNSADADPDEVAQRAENLMTALMGGNLVDDPVALQQAIARIEQSASTALVAAPVMKTVVTPDFQLDERRIGYDFGPPDSTVMTGFRRVDITEDAFLTEDGTPQELQTVRRPNGDPLLVDGVANVREVTLPAPNGRYRVVILSNDFGDSAQFGRPFGEELEVNGVATRIANTQPDEWMDSIALTNARGTDVQAGNFQFIDPNQRGGAIVIDTVVSGGQLRIKFKARPGRSTLLSGIVLEPSDDADSILQPQSEESRRFLSRNQQTLDQSRERRREAESRIQDSAARVLSNLATAAGQRQQQQQTVAALLGPPDPVVDRGTTISAN